MPLRHLVLVLGDQLDSASAALDGFDPVQDAVLMMEVAEEASYIPQHKLRIAMFFAAMRHFRDELIGQGRTVHYVPIDDRPDGSSFNQQICRHVRELRPAQLVVLEPGDHRVRDVLRQTAAELDVPLDERADRHFYCSNEEFDAWAEGRKGLVMEYFYREMRKRHRVLLDDGGKPVGGQWNFDADNRGSFGKAGPGEIQGPPQHTVGATTQEVLDVVAERFADSPGSLRGFSMPVTRRQALAALRDFVEHRLPLFGRYQDAMAAGHPYLYHSRLSAAMNLHLLRPREVVDAAVEAYEAGHAPIESVEGFVRQVIGWREFVRGIYWREMPSYAERNALAADLPMPAMFWTGDTDMRCVRDSVEQLVETGYAHHIQRLMVLGLHALLLGVQPYAVHRWHMSMYADAIDWVSLPNVLGMSQFGDGGIVGTKPYCASGRYIDKMSDYCKECRYSPTKATGEDACPFTVLYWDFLARNETLLRSNRRMAFQMKNLDRKSAADLRAIRRAADVLRAEATPGVWS